MKSEPGADSIKGVGWANVARIAARKLDMLDYAAVLTDLASPPGNRPEALKGNLRGFHSIRINDQWRVVFRWTPASGSAALITRFPGVYGSFTVVLQDLAPVALRK